MPRAPLSYQSENPQSSTGPNDAGLSRRKLLSRAALVASAAAVPMVPLCVATGPGLNALAHPLTAGQPDADLIARCLRWQADHQQAEADHVGKVRPRHAAMVEAHNYSRDMLDTPAGRNYLAALDPLQAEADRLHGEFAAIMGTAPTTIQGATAKAYLCAYIMADAGDYTEAYVSAEDLTPGYEDWLSVLATDLAALANGGAA